MTAALASALEYAARGWHVIPLHPHTTRPVTPRHSPADCDRSDPRCRHGHTTWEERATTNPERIARLWSANTWGIGIACGPSGLLVLDTATRNHIHAETTIAALATMHEPLPPTWTVAAPEGGLHRYYANPGNLTNTANHLGSFINTQGIGGYVIAPPTTTPAGRYLSLINEPIADLPEWIARLLAV